MGNGDVMQGIGATSNESLYPWVIQQSTGIFHVDEKQETGGSESLKSKVGSLKL